MGDYTYYRKITVDKTKVGETDANFAVLLNLTAAGSGVIADLKTTVNGGDIQHTASGGASGTYTVPADLTFRTTADLTQAGANLDFEVEFYDATTGALVAWVQSGVSTASDTDIYMIYGNADVVTSQENVAGTYDTSYKGVWHLNEVSGSRADSTVNANTLTDVNTALQGDGVIGKCADFELDNAEYLAITDAAQTGLDITVDFTLSCWAKFETLGFTHALLSKWHNSSQRAYYMYLAADNYVDLTVSENGLWTDNSKNLVSYVDGPLIADTWYQIVCTYEKATTTGKIYINGVLKVANTGMVSGIFNNTQDFRIGRTAEDVNQADALVDEARISDTARTANYVTTCYNNQSSPSTFYSVGAEEEELAPSFTADAILKETQSSSFTANAILTETQSDSLTADAYLTIIYSLTANAVLKETQSASIIADAILKETQSSSFTADSTLLKTTADTLTADAVLEGIQSDSFTTDAYLINQTVFPKQYLFTKAGPVYLPIFPIGDIVVSVTSNHIANNDSIILCDATSGSFTVTLPAVADNVNTIYTIKKTDVSGNTVVIDGNGVDIDDSGTQTLSSQYQAKTIVSDGVAWWIINTA